MAEYNYRDYIQDKTRLQDKNCCLRYLSCKMGKKKNYEMYHVIVLLWFPEIIFFSLCVSNVLFYVTRFVHCATASHYNFIPFLLERLFHPL